MSQHQLPEHLLRSLMEREQKGLLRKLNKRTPPIDFCSNDYLGFSREGFLSEAVRNIEPLRKSFGSTGSRLISGNSDLIEGAEKHIALFHHAPSALIFNSGYDANVGLFSCIPQKHDLVLYDELIHASIYDGIRLSHATHYKFRHNDMASLQDLITRHKSSYNNIYIAVESVYSMDGDTAPLIEMVDLCRVHERTYMLVDEAHALGVFGKQGRGLCSALNIEKKIFARIYTYGKAMGCHGATIVGSEALRNYLINFSRAFIYSTALPGHSIDAILCAYKLLIETNQQERLQENIAYFYTKASGIKKFIPSQSSIHSMIVGDNTRAEELEIILAKNHLHAKAIKSPTVKSGTERVRFCIHAYNTREEIDNLFTLLNVF
ncbi:MAG: 8-amino-7-oxononanoate synthase [Bacteroidetes bacterium]|nr:8-amino-7-oxononanoate synthase [Bacteroidota bacterium]